MKINSLLVFTVVFCIQKQTVWSESQDTVAEANAAPFEISTGLHLRTPVGKTELNLNSLMNENDPNNALNDEIPVMRTATGGFVNTIMILLTILAFVGNAAFMVDVFWLSK